MKLFSDDFTKNFKNSIYNVRNKTNRSKKKIIKLPIIQKKKTHKFDTFFRIKILKNYSNSAFIIVISLPLLLA